jgi:hypothetical protein
MQGLGIPFTTPDKVASAAKNTTIRIWALLKLQCNPLIKLIALKNRKLAHFFLAFFLEVGADSSV